MIWFVFEAVSGGYLAVADDLERAVHSHRWQHGSTDLGPSAAVKAGQAAVEGGRATTILFPHQANGVYEIFVNDANANSHAVFVNPSTAAVNAVIDPDAGFRVFVLRLHADFNASSVAGIQTATIVGWLGIAWLLNLVLGFAVTRKRRRALTGRRLIRRGRQRYAFHLDLHNAVGLLLVVPAIVAVLTGLVFEFPRESNSVIDALAPGSVSGDRVAVPTSASAAGTRSSLDAVTGSLKASGLGKIESITVPTGNPLGVFTVAVDGGGYSPDEGLFSSRGKTVVAYVDQYTAQVIRVDRGEGESVAAQIRDDWVGGLHFGTFASWISRLLWVVLGLGTGVLAVTGLYMRSGRWPWQRGSSRRLPDPSLGESVAHDAEGDPILEPPRA